MTNSILKKILVSCLALVFVLLAVVSTSHNASATAGTSIGGGSASPGTYMTSYGWGWYRYDLSANEKPDNKADNWDTMKRQCSQYKSIIAFTLLNVTGLKRSLWAVENVGGTPAGNGLQYNIGRPGWKYMGDNGGHWVRWDVAYSIYHNDVAEKNNTVWVGEAGSNVASWFCADRLDDWEADGWSTIDNSTPTVGDTIHWGHVIRYKSGTTDSPGDVYSQVYSWGFNPASGWPTTSNVDIRPLTIGQVRLPTSYATYTVQSYDVGATLCQQVQWDPVNSSGGRDGRGNASCATVRYDYALTPSISLDKSLIEGSTNLSVSGLVNKTGRTQTPNTNWQYSYVVVNPGANSNKSQTVNNQDPCAYYGGSGISCQTGFSFSGSEKAASGSQVFNSNSTALAVRQMQDKEYPVGTKICFGLSVKNAAYDNSGWSHSALQCAVVGKRPLVQIKGNDLLVGRQMSILAGGSSVMTGVKTIDDTSYGSWSEYGATVSGSVVGLASGAGYSGGTKDSMCGVSLLTLSNAQNKTCSSSTVGKYNFNRSRPAVAARFTGGTALPATAVNINNLQKQRVYASDAGSITLTATTDLGKGEWLVINAPNATVNIDSNLTYSNGPFASAAELPQLVIIARNIAVKDTVTQIDSWLLATGSDTNGYLNTCYAAGNNGANLTTSVCNNKLTINGPVAVNHLYLYRTAGAGSGTTSGDPAEVFNYRPDAYLWATANMAEQTKARTVMTTELPPRY